MKKNLILSLFLLGFLFLVNMALAGERPSYGPVVVPSKCNCMNKDNTSSSPGLSPDILIGNSNQMTKYHGNCSWECHHYDYCDLYIEGIGCVYWVHDWKCDYMCRDSNGHPL
jgi:hypothetical protein